MAISDEERIIAIPVAVIKTKNIVFVCQQIAKFAATYQASLILLGDPIRSDGSPGTLHEHIERLAANLRQVTDVSIVLYNEACSTWEATQRISQLKHKKRKRRDLDALAAAVLLEDFMRSRRVE